MEIEKTVGNRIRELRNQKGISQEELAFKASLNASHLSKIERGEKSPTLGSLEKIVKALEISFPDLFNNSEIYKYDIADKTIIDRISAKLSAVSYNDQLAIYRFIKILLWWKSK